MILGTHHNGKKLVELPLSALTQKFAFLGISGSGKTYGAGKLAELMLDEHAQVVVLDNVGNWWGLRVDVNGKPGITIPILGGDHGDVDLLPEHGKLVAETIAGTGSSMVVDFSDFTGGETRRFITDLATHLLAQKKRHPGPVHIIWEECHEIVPQKVFGEDARMVGAVQRLIKKGRNYGIGATLISQRPAAVNKEVLHMCETLLAFRVIGKHDRKAIEDWITDHGSEPNDLPLSKLATGTALLWSPQYLDLREVVAIGAKRTLDASATPDFDERSTVKLAPIDLDVFKVKMADAIETAKKNDPDYLRKRIAELERELDTGAMTTTDPATIAENQRLAHELAEAEVALDLIRSKIADAAGKFDVARTAMDHADEVLVAIQNHFATPRDRAFVLPVRENPSARMTNFSVKEHSATRVKNGMSAVARRILTVLAQHRQTSMTKPEILAHANYASSGKVSSAFAEIVSNQWASVEGRGLKITQTGIRELGAFTPLPKGDALRSSLLADPKFSTMERKILDVATDSYPSSISKAELLARAGYASSGKVSSAFARWVRLGYLTQPSKSQVRAADLLFG